MASYSHDADVVVYNYNQRSPNSSGFWGSIGTMDTTEISLRNAIVSIQCNKTKSSPTGTFGIVLKPTEDWAQVIVPGSWCAIYMSNKKLESEDYSKTAEVVTIDTNTSGGMSTNSDLVDNVISPLKMVGIIMSVRIQKRVENDGTVNITYTINGYDFGYVFTSQIYINYLLQDMVGSGKLQAAFADLEFPTDDEVYADPAVNVERVLNAWSEISSGALALINTEKVAAKVKPPSIKMQIPSAIGELLGTGTEVLQFVTPCIGVDKRTDKVVSVDIFGNSTDFDPQLLGEKAFIIWKLILHNTLWGMINEYLNPIMNEAYCDLHAIKNTGPDLLVNPVVIKPLLIVRQIPFNTPNFNMLWIDTLGPIAAAKEPYPVTMINSLPKTVITSDKVLSFDIGYSEYDRVNFVEINGFLINGPSTGKEAGVFNGANLPAFNPDSITRFGLRPKIYNGVDYGVTISQIDQAGLWRPLLVDWWFNANKFANGTIECIGLSEHIAIGENVLLHQEQILGHIESYTHSFTVDANSGNRIFRTNIEFVKGISAESTDAMFKYVYGEIDAGGVGGDVGVFAESMGLSTENNSIVTDDVLKRSNFTELSPTKRSKFGVPGV